VAARYDKIREIGGTGCYHEASGCCYHKASGCCYHEVFYHYLHATTLVVVSDHQLQHSADLIKHKALINGKKLSLKGNSCMLISNVDSTKLCTFLGMITPAGGRAMCL